MTKIRQNLKLCGMTSTHSAQRLPLAKAIRAELARNGYTQGHLAERLELSHASVSARMTGKIDFTVTELRTVAQWLGVSVTSLLGEAA